MFRLPSAWDIQHSSDECDFSSCDDESDARAGTNRPNVVGNIIAGKPSTNSSTLNIPSTTVQRKRPSSKLGVSLDDSDIETSPRPQVNHQIRIAKSAAPTKADSLSAQFQVPSSSKRAHASASSIEDIEVDSPTPVHAPLLPKKTIPISSSGNPSGWIKSIQDSVFQQYHGNSRSSRSKPNSRTGEGVLIRQLQAAVQRNKETLNSTNYLLNSQSLSALHTREFILLSVVSCEPCHLPVFPVRVSFCHRNSSTFLRSQSVTCYVPIVSVKSMGEIIPGDLLIVGQPWRAVQCIDDLANSTSINIFCSEFVLKCPSVSIRESSSAASTWAYVESLPFMGFPAFADRLVNPFLTDFKPSSTELQQNHASFLRDANSLCVTRHRDMGHEALVLAMSSIMDYESGIATKDLNYSVPVAIVLFRGDSCATVCYCVPGDFEILSHQLVEKHTYFLNPVVKEAHSDPFGSNFRAFIKAPVARTVLCSNDYSIDASSRFGISSRINLQLRFHLQFFFQNRVDHVLISENGHGFGRFRFLDSPVYGCVVGSNASGLLIPILVTSRAVANYIFAFLSTNYTDLDAPEKPCVVFEGLSLQSTTTLSCSPFVVIADGFTKLNVSSHSTGLIAACPSRNFQLMTCQSHSVTIIDSFYIGGDHMCPKCNSSCSTVHSDSLCRHCGFCGSSNTLSSGYLPLFLLVTEPDSSKLSRQVLQIRGGALSSFIAQYMERCITWGDRNAEENLKNSLMFCNSLTGKSMQCCTLGHANLDESISTHDRRPDWISDAFAVDLVIEVLEMIIE